MKTLKLYRRAGWWIDMLKDSSPKMYEIERELVYTCLGEFEHALGHVLMCEFGTWKLRGMCEIDSFEEIPHHPETFPIDSDDR